MGQIFLSKKKFSKWISAQKNAGGYLLDKLYNKPVYNKPIYYKPIAQPKKEDPVYDEDYEDLEVVEQFMITDNDKNNYIVRPVKKRTIEPVKKKITKKKDN